MVKPTLETSKTKDMNFDEAVTLTEFGWFNFYLILSGGGALMCVIMETMGMMYVIPAAECDLQLTLIMKGYISAASFLGVVSGSYIWGFLADTRGRKHIILINLIGSFIMTLISSLVPQDWLFVLFRFLNGLFVSGASSIIYAYTGEFHDNHYRPKIISWISTFVALGIMVLPSLAWVILPGQWSFEIPFLEILFKPWRLLVVAYGLPSLLFALCIAFIPESPKYLLIQGQSDAALDILKKVYAINTRKPKEEFPVTNVFCDENLNNSRNKGFFKRLWTQTTPLFKQPLAWKTFLVCGLQFGVFMTTSGLAMWYPEILNRLAVYKRDNPDHEVKLCNAIQYYLDRVDVLNNTMEEAIPQCSDAIEPEVFTIGIITGSFLALTYIAIGGLINILGKKNLLTGFFVLSSTAGILSQYLYGSDILKILMNVVTISSTTVGLINAIAVDLYPTNVRAMALAISLMFGRIGAVTGAQVTGLIFYQICDYTFFVITAINILLIVLVILLPSSPRAPKIIATIT